MLFSRRSGKKEKNQLTADEYRDILMPERLGMIQVIDDLFNCKTGNMADSKYRR